MILQRLIYAIGAMMLSYILSEVTLDAAQKLEQTGKFTFLVKILTVIYYFSGIGALFIGLYMRLHKGNDVALNNRIIELSKELQESKSSVDSLSNENKHLKAQQYNQPRCNLDAHAQHGPEVRLATSLEKILTVSSDDMNALQLQISTLCNSIRASKVMSLNDIDTFIDWVFSKGYYALTFRQYLNCGLVVSSSCKIYVPHSICNEFEDYSAMRTNAAKNGLLLSHYKSAPNLDLWNTELSTYLPGFFEYGDVNYVSILETIIHLADEAPDDDASLPEYIARLSGLPHKRERDMVNEASEAIDHCLRVFAKELCIDVEPVPNDERIKLGRLIRHSKRTDIARKHRHYKLISENIDDSLNSSM